jgi:hypothetical protein
LNTTQLVLATNLLVPYREEIVSESSLIPIMDYDHTTAYGNWSGIAHLKARFSTARELNLVAIACDLNRSNLTTMDAIGVSCRCRNEFRPMTHGYVLAIKE